MDLALPLTVRAALRENGVEPSGPLGVGSSGLRWSALGPGGTRYAVVHASGARAGTLRARAEDLARVEHPALATCARVLTSADGVVVLVDAAPGTDLAVLQEARGSIPPGEVVSLLAPVADALAVLHGADLVHGDVSPANIVVTERGPVLVDLLGAADPDERGTPGFSDGRSGADACPVDDVVALGLVCRALLGPAPQAGDDPGRSELLEACDAVSSQAPARPTARSLGESIRGACPALPLEDADPAVLARLGLRRLSGVGTESLGVPYTVRADGRSRRGRPRHRDHRWFGRASASPVAAGTRGWEAAVRVAGVGVLAVALAAGGVAAVALGRESAADAAVRLTKERAAALVTADTDALVAVTVPGSAAARVDAATAEQVEIVAGARGPGRAPVSWEIEAVAEGVVPCESEHTCVAVRTITTSDGVQQSPRRVVLVLEEGPWRVAEVRPGE